MKRFYSIFIAVCFLFTLTACDVYNKDNVSPKDSASSEKLTSAVTDDIIWQTEEQQNTVVSADNSSDRFSFVGDGQFQVLPSEEVKVDTSKLNIAGNYNVLTPTAMQNAVSVSGLESDFVPFFTDEIVLKILAGDSDVDIYLLNASSIKSLVDRGIYIPMESDIISEFNDGCFDYLSCVATDSNGKTVAMPLSSNVSFLSYPVQAANELGFDAKDIAYYNDFHNLVNNYQGERKSFSRGDLLVSLYELQYEEHYCDFADNKYDYDTKLYKEIYSLYEGWQRVGQMPVMTGFTNPSELGVSSSRLMLDSEKTLFNTTADYSDFVNACSPDILTQTDFEINDWRASHIPWISEKVNTNFVNATFAFINPYSKHFDESVKLLEYIAENYFGSVNSYTFIREDKNEYPDSFRKETQLFDDVYEISKKGFVLDYRLLSSRNDIDEYQNGKLTLDEAIAMYSREVEMWLNE